MTTHILKIDASARQEGSTTRALTGKIVDQLSMLGGIQLTTRDVADGLPFVDQAWIGANFTPADDRTLAQKEKLGLSDSLIAEIKAADVLVIGMPIYNFGIPASLKAWVDLICRAGVTFRYTENGPVGLLEGKRAIIALASGGTPMDSAIDFASPYIRQALKFIGITDVTFFAADALSRDSEAKLAQIHRDIQTLTLDTKTGQAA